VGTNFTNQQVIRAAGYQHTHGNTLVGLFGEESKLRALGIKQLVEWIDNSDDQTYSAMAWGKFQSFVKGEIREAEEKRDAALKTTAEGWRDRMGMNNKGDRKGSGSSRRKQKHDRNETEVEMQSQEASGSGQGRKKKQRQDETEEERRARKRAKKERKQAKQRALHDSDHLDSD
jgi:hypothetical protein